MSETEQPLEVREAAILEEVRQLLEQNENALHAKFNNLAANLAPEMADEGSKREALRIRGALDVKFVDDMKPQDLNGHSDLRKNQTHREFYQTIDSVMDEFDPNHSIRNEIVEMIHLRPEIDISQPKSKRRIEDTKGDLRNAINIQLIPMYARLRAIGYVDRDIVL